MALISDSIGRVLSGRYRIEAPLGSGSSAHVFAALDVTLKRRVAVKVLHPALAGDANFLRRFRAEAQAAAALTHPHILSVYDWGQDGGEPFLVLEYLGGGSLRDLLDSGRRLTVPQAVAVGIQAAKGLAYANGRGFVHRDIKPANLLFDEEGRLEIADFGLARALSEASWTEPTGAAVGTARYSAPEQASGKRVDGRADVYSLALVLYEAVTGVVPFTADTTVGTLMARVGATLPGNDALGLLGPILAPAAAPEVEQRLDAGVLVQRLQTLANQLDDPTPLPLAGAGGRGLAGAVPADLTEHGFVPTPPAPVAPVLFDQASDQGPGEEAYMLAVADAVGITAGAGQAVPPIYGAPPADWATPSGAGVAPPPEPTLARRRWPWVTALVLVLVAGLAVGGVYAAQRTKVFTPSHDLPVVTGLTVSLAQGKLGPDKLSLTVSHQVSSLTAPAGTIVREIPGAGTPLKEGSGVIVVVSSGPPPVPVPDLSQVSSNACTGAGALLVAARLSLGSCTSQSSMKVAQGAVMSWSPTGTAPEQSAVNVVYSSGPPLIGIPSLAGITTCTGVESAFTAVGLTASCNTAYSSAPPGQVIGESSTTTAPEGSTVSVTLSKGPKPIPVPDLSSDSLNKALDTLAADGLVAGNLQGPSHGSVYATNPVSGTLVTPGTTVDIYLQPGF